MTILIDTNVLIAWMNPPDPLHGRATDLMTRILKGEWGEPVVPDHVVSEAFTFLRMRVGRLDVAQRLQRLLFEAADNLFQLRTTSLEDLREAVDLHLKYHDRRLSIPDCVLIVHTSDARATLATLAKEFDGIVPVAR